jgi:hypothetical protein
MLPMLLNTKKRMKTKNLLTKGRGLRSKRVMTRIRKEMRKSLKMKRKKAKRRKTRKARKARKRKRAKMKEKKRATKRTT